MKKVMTILIAAAIILCGAVLLKGGFAVSAKDSPTAPTITDPSHMTVTIPPDNTTNTATSTPGGGGTTSPGGGGTTSPGGTKPGGQQGTSGVSPTSPTAPGGSTITGTVRPDQNPDSPKTGEASSAVFAFAAVALTGAAAAMLVKRNKETD